MLLFFRNRSMPLVRLSYEFGLLGQWVGPLGDRHFEQGKKMIGRLQICGPKFRNASRRHTLFVANLGPPQPVSFKRWAGGCRPLKKNGGCRLLDQTNHSNQQQEEQMRRTASMLFSHAGAGRRGIPQALADVLVCPLSKKPLR